jgi:hypothetical protein
MATDSVFNNVNLLHNIREADVPVRFRGVNGGGKPLIATMCGDFLDICNVYICENASANLLSFSDLRTQSDVNLEYDYSSNIFIITTHNDNEYIFNLRDKLYTCNFGNNAYIYDTVLERESLYTERQIRAARDVRIMLKRLGSPNRNEIANMIKYNVFMNCPYTYEDIYRAYDIYGPDLRELRGKTVRRVPIASKPYMIPRVVPSELTLNIDIFYIDNDAYLVSVSSDIAMTMVNYLGRLNIKDGKIPVRSATVVFKHLLQHINNYKARNFFVKMINCDGEGAFAVVSEDLKARGIAVNTFGPEQHVGVV